MFKYFNDDKKTGHRKEITKEQATHKVLGVYKDCDITRDMLTIVNRIDCGSCYISIDDIDGDFHKALMAGCTNFTPWGVRYDNEGNRVIKEANDATSI